MTNMKSHMGFRLSRAGLSASAGLSC